MISLILPSKEKADDCYSQDTDIQFIVESKGHSRAERINNGIEQAQHSMILILHPRSQLEPEAIEWLKQNAHEKIWGGFTHQFDKDHPLLKFTSWYSNKIRGEQRGIIYLDHCIFFHRDLLPQKRPVPEREIFEDTLLSLELLKKKRPVLVDYKSTTSAIRFEKNGIYYQAALNQVLKIAYHCGASDKTMNKIYEMGLGLN